MLSDRELLESRHNWGSPGEYYCEDCDEAYGECFAIRNDMADPQPGDVKAICKECADYSPGEYRVLEYA